MECYTVNYKAAPGYDELFLLDPTTDVIFPGAILKGETIPTGEYVPILQDRAPITLSASLQNIEGNVSVEINDPKLSTIRESVKSILDQEVTGATPAQIQYDTYEVYSKEQLNMSLATHFSNSTVSVDASFDFSSTNERNKYVVRFQQIYYTLDMDLPEQPSDLFTTPPSVNSLGSSKPVYVSSVKYGRKVLYMIESTRSSQEINAAMEAAYNAAVNVEVDLDTNHKQVLEESKIEALIIGGSGETGAATIGGPEEVMEHISEGGNYSKDSPGAMLSYTLRFPDNSVARVVLGSEYTVRQCDLAYPKYEIKLESLECVKCEDGISSGEVYGRLYAHIVQDGEEPDLNDFIHEADIYWVKSAHPDSHIGGMDNGDTYDFDDSYQITKEVYRPDYDNPDDNYILLGGVLWETDGDDTATWRDPDDGDDLMGEFDTRIPLQDVEQFGDEFEGSGEDEAFMYTLKGTDGGEVKTRVTFKVRRVR